VTGSIVQVNVSSAKAFVVSATVGVDVNAPATPGVPEISRVDAHLDPRTGYSL
jgi:hypothetical protein